jgi:hypothetical protein
MINASFIGRKFNFNFALANTKMPTNSEGANTLKHELHAQIHKELDAADCYGCRHAGNV